MSRLRPRSQSTAVLALRTEGRCSTIVFITISAGSVGTGVQVCLNHVFHTGTIWMKSRRKALGPKPCLAVTALRVLVCIGLESGPASSQLGGR